jgi:hypothetical protein
VQAALDAIQPDTGPVTIRIVEQPYGYLITSSRIFNSPGDLTAASYYLGRTSPPFPWPDARFCEYQNTGPGSAVNADVPQLTAAQATQYTVASYLGGWWPK